MKPQKRGVNKALLVGRVVEEPTVIFTITGGTTATLKLSIPDPNDDKASVQVEACAADAVAEYIDANVVAQQDVYIEGGVGPSPDACNALVYHIHRIESLKPERLEQRRPATTLRDGALSHGFAQ